MNLVQDLARQIKASLPFAVLNEDPRNMFEKLVTYKSLSDIPSNIHIFNTTGNSTSDFIIKRENAPGGIGFTHPTLEIRAGKDVGEYNTLAFNTYAGGPLAKISTEVVAAGIYPNSIAKLHFAIQNGAGQQTMLTISENSTSEFAGSVGIGKSPSFALDVDGNINISAGNTLKIDGVDAVFSNWSTNGATIYRNSNVGIGDFSGSAPSEALDIDGSINLSAGNTLKIDGVAAVFSNWTVDGSDIYRLSNVGIGISDPQYTLDLDGGTTVQERVRVGRGSDDTAQYMTLGWDNITTHRNNVPIVNNQTALSFIQKGSDGSRTAMYIDGQGKIGIGTTSPVSILHVNAEASFGTDNNNRAAIGFTGSRFYAGTIQSGTNYFDTLNVTSGNVGIGTTDPENKFHSRVTAIGAPSGGYDARYKWLFEHDNEHYIGMYHKSTSYTGIRFFDETGGTDGGVDYYGSGITPSGTIRAGTVVISGKEGVQIREGSGLISDFSAEEIWSYDRVRTKNYSFSNLTMSAGGKAWVKLFTTAHRGNITINFSAGAGNAQDWSVIELNLTYYALRSKITVKKSTYQVVLEAVRLIQQSDGANQEVWVKLNVDSNVLATQTYFSWNIDNWSPYDGLAINNTIQYTEPTLPGNAGWHKTLELNRTSHDLDRVATATSGGGIFKAGMEFPLMEGKALIMEVQPDVYWSLAWWEASDGSWWLLGRQGRHPNFVRADAEFYIPTGNILDVPAS